MKKATKTIVTLLIILSILVPVLFFLIYPNYNNIILTLNSFDVYTMAKESSTKTLIQISPLREKYKEAVLGYTSIEESLKESEINLERKILEESGTKVVITDLNIEGPILEGESSLRMDDGFWHFPISSFPGEKGNMVVIGHRFMHIPPNPNTFFNLDSAKIGQHIKIVNQDGEFTYIVVEKKEVEPNDLSVIQETDDYRLTLITCTPLWTSEKRLVIVAKLDKLYKKV